MLKPDLLEERKKTYQSTILQRAKVYDFEVSLENHLIGNQTIYRLYYVNYHKIGEGYLEGRHFGVIKVPFRPFQLPEQMAREGGFKVLSYLTDFIEANKNVAPCSLQSIRMLDHLLNAENLRFRRIDEEDESKILDLFAVDGRVRLFKKSDLYEKYFE